MLKIIVITDFFSLYFSGLEDPIWSFKISLVDNHSIHQSKKTFKAKNEFLNSLSLTV